MGRPKLIENATKMVVYMDQETEDKIKQEAEKEGLSPSQLVRRVLREYCTNK